MPSVGIPFKECEFEITPYAAGLTGAISAEVWESGGTTPTGIIRTDQAWYVKVNWRLAGPLRHHLCGQFCVALHIECMGAGPEQTLGTVKVDMDPCGDGTYETYFNVPPGTISGSECGQVCCLFVTMTSFDKCGNPGHIAAYCEGPCVMFAAAATPDV